ncbi:MAG: carboxypeptidase regulatory-like domain-containing protein, partial [Thermoanaerobaculia bacterium]
MEIDFEGHEVFTVITLEAVGEVVGKVFNPDTGASVPGAKASLYRFGFFDSITTDENGEFRFLLLPLGNYQVGVFDPTTGRRGKSAWVEVASNGQVARADVSLEVRGEVDGTFYDGTADNPIPGATVKLSSRGLKWFTTYSSTGENGYFEFFGIPEGEFDLSAIGPARRRQARASGEIQEEDQRVTVDLVLEAFAAVAGQVLFPGGGLLENVNVRLVQGNPFGSFDVILGATTDNPFEFSGILPGDHFTIYADEIGGLHRTVFHGVVDEPGS